MKGLLPLADFLKTQKVTDQTPQEVVETLTKKYWQEYHKRYHQERKQTEKRVTLRLTNQEYARLKNERKTHSNLAMSQLIKESAFAYFDQGYIPHEKEAIEALTQSLRTISRTINQVVQKIHRTAKYQNMQGGIVMAEAYEFLGQQYETLVEHVELLHTEIHQFLTKPPATISKALSQILTNQPEKIASLRTLLHEIEQNQS